MQVITSKDNEIVKNIKKLKEKKYRDQSGQYIIEGIKLVKEAIEEKASIHKIVLCEDCENNGTIAKSLMYEIAKYDCIYVSKKVFETLTDVNTPQGILAVISRKNSNEQVSYKEDIIVVLDGIQDPGNLGTILRTVDSVGLTQIVLSEKTADPYNPKVVRSTMGAIFRLNIIQSKDIIETLKNIKKNKYKLLATSLEDSESIYTTDLNKKAIIIGNEANGVSEDVFEIVDKKTKIPMLRKNRKLKCSCSNRNYIVRICKKKNKLNN